MFGRKLLISVAALALGVCSGVAQVQRQVGPTSLSQTSLKKFLQSYLRETYLEEDKTERVNKSETQLVRV